MEIFSKLLLNNEMRQSWEMYNIQKENTRMSSSIEDGSSEWDFQNYHMKKYGMYKTCKM